MTFPVSVSDSPVIVDWTYTPTDFFVRTVTVSRQGYEMTIEQGRVQVRINVVVFDSRSKMTDELDAMLRSRFDALGVFSHRPYQLGSPTIKRLDSNGNVRAVFFAETLEVLCAKDHVDVLLRDVDGKVLRDTHAERVASGESFAERVSRHDRDPLLKTLMTSYIAGVSDPMNELVHLYEVRDAIAQEFGGDAEARSTLGIPKAKWSRLGRICNDLPLKQGRHRGRDAGALREATAEELSAARTIAVDTIKHYLDYLEARSSSCQGPIQ